ncbi:MAG: Fur family transcriptional regulator [Ilumatobacteraceae bacterium]
MAHDHPHGQPHGQPHDSAGLAHEVAARLATVNQRLTPTRRAIVEALATADRPLSIPEILASDTSLAQSSVYRNLSVLERAGAVARVVTTDEWARFELSEDLTGHHHHLICERCGSVVDIDVPSSLEEGVSSFSSSIARSHGFRIEHHRLDLIGVCPACTAAAH